MPSVEDYTQQAAALLETRGAPISEETGAPVGEKKWETLIDAAVQMTIRPVNSMAIAAMAPTRMTAAAISSLLLKTFSTPASLRAM